MAKNLAFPPRAEVKKARVQTGKGLRRETAQSKSIRQTTNTSSKAGAALVNPDKPLTEKQLLFAKLWAQGETIQSAYIRAGYADDPSSSFAYRMARMPNIVRVYQIEKVKYEEASQMTRKKVMDGLLEGIDMCKLTADGPGVITGWKTVG
jgi:hypothetical protein